MLRRVATNESFTSYGLTPVDPARSAFAVTDRAHCLRLIDGMTLGVRLAWSLPEDAAGTHAVRAPDEVALISGRSAVTLLDRQGEMLWTFRHERAWGSGNSERGCAWFDANGEPFALVPDSDSGCEIVHLSRRDGRVLARKPIATEPAGAEALLHPDGWVGLSVGEGQDGSYAWWVRLSDGEPVILAAGWNDEVLFDVDGDGGRVLTTPHNEGPLRVRTFPSLKCQRKIDPPEGSWWDFYACFVGRDIVAKSVSDDEVEMLMRIDADGFIHTLAQSEHPIVPGPRDSWLTLARDGLERWKLDAAAAR